MFSRSLLACIPFALIACGGADSSHEDAAPSAQAPAPAQAAQMILSGSAGDGQPLAAAKVVATCVSGTGTGTTDASGAFSVSIPAGQGPCLVTVTKPETQKQPTSVLRAISCFGRDGQGLQLSLQTEALVSYLEKLAGVSNAQTLVTDPAVRALLLDKAALEQRVTDDLRAFMKYTLQMKLSDHEGFKPVVTPDGGLNATVSAIVEARNEADNRVSPAAQPLPELVTR